MAGTPKRPLTERAGYSASSRSSQGNDLRFLKKTQVLSGSAGSAAKMKAAISLENVRFYKGAAAGAV
jgi:hypothetical protein